MTIPTLPAMPPHTSVPPKKRGHEHLQDNDRNTGQETATPWLGIRALLMCAVTQTRSGVIAKYSNIWVVFKLSISLVISYYHQKEKKWPKLPVFA